MVHDYSRRYSPIINGQKKMPKQRRFPGGSFLLSRILGTAMMAVALAGITASVWLNWRIENTLVELAGQKELLAGQQEENVRLQEERGNLLTSEAIRAKAAVHGLYLPEKEQLRRP
ncbi:MAG: hypothetical protein AB1568_03585 [Thermodesulfobacteriota bacterium]